MSSHFVGIWHCSAPPPPHFVPLVLVRGTTPDMLALELSLHETLPIWPGERQLLSIQKQVARGLRTLQ